MLKEVLDKALKEPITQDETLFLFREIQKTEDFMQLASVASKIRDDEVGAVFNFDGFIGALTPCSIDPPCQYCSRSAKETMTFRDCLTTEEVETAAQLMKKAGVKRVEIGGGTFLDGAGKKIIEATEVIKKVAPFEIWVNVGPALTADDLARLKELGVSEVCSSLETINPDVFKEVKPGDSLEARKNLAEAISEAGLGLTSVMMVGIGSSYEDMVEHLFWYKTFNNQGHFCITGFNPMPGTPLQNRPIANPFEVAKTGAIARLVLKTPDISFGGMMNDFRLLPLMIMVGGNRVIHLGAHVHRANGWRQPPAGTLVEKHGNIDFFNMLPVTTRIVKEMGMETDIA